MFTLNDINVITLMIEQDRSWELHPMGNQRLIEAAKELGTIQVVSVC